MLDTDNQPLEINQQYIIRRNIDPNDHPEITALIARGDFANGVNVFTVNNIEYDDEYGVNMAYCTFLVDNVPRHSQWYSVSRYTFERVRAGGRKKSRRLRKRFRRTRK